MDDNGSDETSPQWRPVWLVPLLLGLVTVTAGFFTWRAGQLGSAAAFEDRTAVSQTIRQEEQAIEATLAAVDDAVTYVGYVADFAEAAGLDDLADEVERNGDPQQATSLRDDAGEIRSSATDEAAAAGVFGRQTLLAQAATAGTEPLSFDFDDQRTKLLAQVATGVRSPGLLDPDTWAAQADDTRRRVRGLRFATLWLIAAVAALTVAQLHRRRPARIAGLAVGCSVYVVVAVATLATVY